MNIIVIASETLQKLISRLASSNLFELVKFTKGIDTSLKIQLRSERLPIKLARISASVSVFEHCFILV